MIINNIKFLGSRIMPNPIEVDYWVDTRSDPYGSVIKYYNGTDWVLLNTGGSNVDLSNYYTKDQVDSRISGKADVLYVNTQINTMGSTKADKTSVYTKSEVDSMFLNFDAFDESKYYTKTDIDSKGYLTTVPTIYITEDELTTVLEQYPSFEYVYSKSEVDKKITDAITGGTVDLSNYYTKSEVDTLIPTDYITSIPSEYVTESELNAKGYLQAIPSEYVTETELDAKGYLTEHQSLDNYYTKSEVDNKVASGGSFDSSQYYTKEEVDAKGYITEVPAEYITEDELNNKGYLTEVPSEYVTETELAGKGYLTEHQSLSDYYTKNEVDTLIDGIDIPDIDLSGYYDKDEVDALLLLKANADNVYDKVTVDQKITDAVTGGAVDLSNYYNKGEVDQLIADIDIPETDLSDYYTKDEVTNLIPDVSGFITSEDIPTNVGELNNDVGYITLSEVPTADLTGYATENWVESKGYLTEHQDISSLATKTELTEGLATKQGVCLKFSDLSASTWVADTTYSDFGYRCDLACSDVTSDMYAEVVFEVAQAASGNYAPICETSSGIVSIWSSVQDAITVPVIIITK